MEVIHKNLKEDLKLLVSLGKEYNGEHFQITLRSGKYGVQEYVCGYDGTTYTNCEMADDTHVLCLLDNHGLPCGLVNAEMRVCLPDTQMQDGDYRLNTNGPLEFIYEGKPCHLELTNGKSDPVYTPEVTFELLGTVLRGNKGERGEQGPQGIPGNDGQDGAPGNDGQDGAPGKDGRDGKDGGLLYPKFRVDPHNMHLYCSEDTNRITLSNNKHLIVKL